MVLYQGLVIIILLDDWHVPRHLLTLTSWLSQTRTDSCSSSHVTPTSSKMLQVTWLNNAKAIVIIQRFVVFLKEKKMKKWNRKSESNKCPSKDGPRKRKIFTFYGTRANGEDGVRPRWITFSSFHNSSHHTQLLSIIVHYYSVQILCRFWLALTIFGICEQYTIYSMVHLPENEAAWVNSELKKMAFTAIRRRNSWISE